MVHDTGEGIIVKFIDQKIPWAHFDIYAWSDSEVGALTEKGGSGQAVQGLIGLVEKGG